MTHSATAVTLAEQPDVSDGSPRLRIHGDHPRFHTANMLVVEYTESQAGGRRGQVAVMDWIARHARFEHVNYGQKQHMASLVTCDVRLDRDAPTLIRKVMRDARRKEAAYVLFHLVG